VTAKPKPRPIDIQQPQIATQLPTQSQRSSRDWLNLLLKTGGIACLGLVVLTIIGVGVGRWWAKDHLGPIVAKEVSKAIKRPIKLGEIENIWFDRVHLTNINIPVNGADQNQLAVRDLFVTFNPWQVIFDRTIKLDVRVVAPSIYLAQNSKGSWINLPAQEKTPPSPIKVEVGTVNIESAQVIVVPLSKNPQPITISKINLQADVDDLQQRVTFNGGAQFAKNGQVKVQGNTLIANGKTQLIVNGKKLDAATATKIVKIPEVEITQGTVDGDLKLEIELQKSLKISSKLLVTNGRLLINYVPRSLDQINGWIEVSEQEVKFNDVTTKYDRVPGVIAGTLNYSTGYKLNAKIAPITLPDVIKSIGVQSPFPLAGQATGALQLAGKLDRPILTGQFNNSQTNQVDRVDIDRLSGDFKLADNKINLNATATPQVGGKITTQGQINLLKTPLTNFKVQGSQLPGDALIRLYGAKLPAQLQIGAATIQGTIGGAGADIYTNIHVDAPAASYPIATDLQITPQGRTLIKAATLAAAGGKVLATGEVTATNWLLNLQPQNLDSQKLATIGGISLPVNYAGKLAGNIQAMGSNSDLDLNRIQASGNLNLQLPAGKITTNRFMIDRGKWQANVSSDALDLQQIAPGQSASGESNLPAGMVSGNFNLSGNSLKNIDLDQMLIQGSGAAKLKAGEIQSTNLTIANGNWQGLFTTKDFQLAEINPKINGQLSGAFNLAGNLQQLKPESIRGAGQASLQLPQGKIFGDKLRLDRGKWQGNIQSTGLVLGGLVPEIPANFKQAKLAGNVQVAGDFQRLKPQDISIAGNAQLSLAGGTIAARQLAIKAGKWQGNFGFDRLKLGSVSTEIPAAFETAQLTGNFGAAGDLTNFSLDRLQIAGNGELSLDQAKVRATSFKLEEGNWSSKVVVAGAKLGTFNQQLSPQLQAAKISGKFNMAGNINQLTPTAIQANGNGQLNLANGGEIKSNNFALIDGGWQTNLAVSGLQLGTVNRQLPVAIKTGLLFGQFQANGNLKYPELEQIQANGSGQIRNILGGNIQVDQLKLDRGQWQSNVIADRLNIGQLAKFAPKNLNNVGQLAGELSTNWQIGGSLQSSSLASFEVLGQTKLTNLQVGQLKFDPNLIGNIQANPGQGVDISFAGKNDKLALSLDRNLQPQSFAVQQQGIIANGNVDGKILGINFQQLPVNLLQPWIPKAVGIEAYRFDGMAKGDLAINLTNYQIAGKQIEVTKPIFGAFQGDRLSSDFRYTNGKFNLDNTEIQRGEHTYKIDASIDTTANTPTFQTKLQVPKGSIEDVRNLLQIFSFNDLFVPFNQRKYGTATDLINPTAKIANRPQPLYNELRRLSELRRWLKKETDRQQASSLFPDVGNLQGDFSGEISISNSLKTGLNTSFKIDGSNWLLTDQSPVLNQPEHRYQIDRLQAAGNWNNGKLHLDPLKLTIENSQIDVAGDFGVNGQNAKLNVQNVPTEWLTSFVDLPVDIQGGINLTAQVSGNIANPQANGDIALINGQLNNTKLQDPKVNFSYRDGRLNFTGDSTFTNRPIVSTTDRINVSGSIPYQMPFSLKPPASRDIRVELSLENQGLQILDVFSKQQLHWIDGQGKIDLKVNGKMKPSGGIASLSASGVGNIRQGRIKSVAIAEPFTDINGEIIFDFDRIEVQKLTGKLAKGQVNIAGIIPISDSFLIDEKQQLQIHMNGIPVNIPDKYNGDVNGNVKIIGTALNPVLTGDVLLNNGQALLPDTSGTTATGSVVKPATSETTSPNALQIRNLQITLGDNLQITRAPILSFLATGKIDINGTLDNPRPFGQVQLQKGSVNLFTTQFRLASGAQTADFFPTLGPDPVLNLRLYAKTLSSTANLLTQRNSIARTTNKNGEIDRPADFYTTSLGSVQTVQVEARIAGLASQLTERLELNSTPAMTQSEIVLLLGGAIVEQLSAGDNIGLGVASVAGSSLLNSIQDRISDLFNLSDFRLFPTIIRDSKTSSTSTLGIAAEVGTEISPKVSTSVFKILTNSESPYYSIRYRLNDQLLLRGSTNLFGENRALLEFEQRF
jgi:translocation and assembly module TamB